MIENDIVQLIDRSNGWGGACNDIQDAAYRALTLSEWNSLALRQTKDAEECEGSDYLVMNGRYFDWREFERKELDIIRAYLSYFTQPQLEKILNFLKKEGGK